MKIAILGAGFAGLATAWHVLQYPNIQLTLFDPLGIGGGASGLSAALLHSFAGPHSRLNEEGLDGLAATQNLLEVATCYAGKVSNQTGILRPALTGLQKEKFLLASRDYPENIRWLTVEEMQNIVPGLPGAPGIHITEGHTVYAKKYLNGLWLACQDKGASIQSTAIAPMDASKSYDAVVIAIGGVNAPFEELNLPQVSRIKGQLLELEWPKGLAPLPTVINSQLYCIMSQDQKSCFVGSTFERQFDTVKPNLTVAKAEILPKLKELYPPLVDSKILHCHAAVRVSAPGRKPLLHKASNNCWVFTGLASKGLLYHALYGKRLADMIYMHTFNRL